VGGGERSRRHCEAFAQKQKLIVDSEEPAHGVEVDKRDKYGQTPLLMAKNDARYVLNQLVVDYI
jgi:hypothetical protein